MSPEKPSVEQPGSRRASDPAAHEWRESAPRRERPRTADVAELYAELGRTDHAPRGGRARRWWVRSLVLATGLVCGACLSARLPNELLASAARPPRAEFGRVGVRLAEAEGRLELELVGRLSTESQPPAARSWKLLRDGRNVVAIGSDGREIRAPWIELDSHSAARTDAAAGEASRFSDRLYRGKILVEPRPAGGLRATHHVELEDYVRDVVAAEISLWNANPAELGAQAIAARSYAHATLATRGLDGTPPYLWDDQRDQVFRGRFQPTPAEQRRGLEGLLDRAVDATRGQVLALSGQVATAGFHASCGGRTSLRSEVFGGTDGASALTPCEPCSGRPAGRQEPAPTWNWTASPSQLAAVARAFRLGDRLESVRPVSVDSGGRWLTVELRGNRGTTVRRFQELRRELGFDRLPSGVITRTWPTPGTPIENGLYFEGRGRGHGVGLCQHGAHGYGERGWGPRRILEHYYSGAEITVR